MPNKVWNKISQPFPYFNDFTVEIWEWIRNFIPQCDGCNYLSMLGSKLIHVSKRGPRYIEFEGSAFPMDMQFNFYLPKATAIIFIIIYIIVIVLNHINQMHQWCLPTLPTRFIMRKIGLREILHNCIEYLYFFWYRILTWHKPFICQLRFMPHTRIGFPAKECSKFLPLTSTRPLSVTDYNIINFLQFLVMIFMKKLTSRGFPYLSDPFQMNRSNTWTIRRFVMITGFVFILHMNI